MDQLLTFIKKISQAHKILSDQVTSTNASTQI